MIKSHICFCKGRDSACVCSIGIDQSDADLIIARGRLGIPGSGSLLIFIDNKGRILTCGTSPSHAIHQKPIEEAVYNEACEALEKIGFEK